MSDKSRAEVVAEAKRARAAGEIPTGEAEVTKKEPEGGPKIPATPK